MNGPVKAPDPLRLTSGLAMTDPLDRLLAFCAEEYPYYGAIPSTFPKRIEPIDILATVSMNSFVNSANRVGSAHRGLATACDPILAGIPENADLRSFDLAPVRAVGLEPTSGLRPPDPKSGAYASSATPAAKPRVVRESGAARWVAGESNPEPWD
jgi:hypothetical protein